MKTLDAKLSNTKSFSEQGDGNSPDLLLRHSINNCSKIGLFMEFGVAKGRSLAQIRQFMDQKNIQENLYGFDWFNGLPEDWIDDKGRICHSKGQFSCTPPEVGGKTQLVVGLFQDTLPKFLETHPGPVAFAHIDCDLYSSTVFILEQLQNRIVAGTILEFDEICGEPSYVQHEGRAFCEFAKANEIVYEVIGKTNIAAAIKIKEIKQPTKGGPSST